jgi:hypothetical protein
VNDVSSGPDAVNGHRQRDGGLLADGDDRLNVPMTEAEQKILVCSTF